MEATAARSKPGQVSAGRIFKYRGRVGGEQTEGDEVKTNPLDALLCNRITQEALRMLKLGEEKIIRMRFGFDETPRTQKQIADVLKLSPSRVCMLEKKRCENCGILRGRVCFVRIIRRRG